ncbi:MAG: hypothetical protein ACFFDT_24380 [Candidatus Hodarchaeota archaeon]
MSSVEFLDHLLFSGWIGRGSIFRRVKQQIIRMTLAQADPGTDLIRIVALLP